MARWQAALVLGALALAGSVASVGVGILPGPPLYEEMDFVTRVTHSSAAALWVHGDHAYVSGIGGGLFIVDISNPEAPVKVGSIGGFRAVDVDILAWGGRLYAITANGNNDDLHVVDVTDPAAPFIVKKLDVGATVHNINVLHGTPYIYVSRGGLGLTNPAIDIVDASNPASPFVAHVWTAPPVAGTVPLPVVWGGCHDMAVDVAAGRGYCAGGVQSFIMDITNPLDPVIVSVIPNPLNTFHHTAIPNADHTVLILGDEYVLTLGPGCLANVDTPASTASPPTGALFFYDITVPEAPLLLSWMSAPTLAGLPCTAHDGVVLGDEDIFAAGYYRAGVLLIDFRVPALPKVLDVYKPADANVWDVKYQDGYLFTGNIGRGMDVLRLT